MKSIYELLAPVYDKLNEDVDYEAMASYAERIFQTHATHGVERILDIGCGTGGITLPLARRGYAITALDLSPEMLSVACAAAERDGTADRILFLMQDMTALDLRGTYDAVLCTMDGLNHLSNRAALSAAFAGVRRYLAPGGVFLFDMNTRYKFEEIYGNEVYTMETDGAYCIWQNEYHPAAKRCDFWITLFERQKNGLYARHEALQTEHYYSDITVSRVLRENGLRLLAAYGGQALEKTKEKDERRYYVAGIAE